jgi:hypothetical protein
LEVFEVDSLVDNPALHLKWKYPEKEAEEDDEKKYQLPSPKSVGYPVKKSAFGDYGFS